MKFYKLNSKGEGKIENGIYAYQEAITIEGTIGMTYVEEIIKEGQCMCVQGWFTPVSAIDHKKLLKDKSDTRKEV